MFRYKVNGDPKYDEHIDRPYDGLRWEWLINFENREKMKLMDHPFYSFSKKPVTTVQYFTSVEPFQILNYSTRIYANDTKAQI